jgi:hypothetical protein
MRLAEQRQLFGEDSQIGRAFTRRRDPLRTNRSETSKILNSLGRFASTPNSCQVVTPPTLLRLTVLCDAETVVCVVGSRTIASFESTKL